ncbi:MAG: DUF4417 domain-containing protein, partial [Coriobacteriales bacterium]|nr:DUF4417 domain-containing protein [Coriobacteriales bacterium]
IKVLPTVGWSDAASLCFCFDGIAEESDVVISTLGAKKRPDLFWPGFIELEKRVHPHTIFCYGKQFPGMHRFGNVVIMPYAGDIAKRKQIAGQIQMVVPS